MTLFVAGSAKSEDVDAELVLLVDTSLFVSPADFDASLEGFAQAFESAAVVDALQNGQLGSIAASLVFFSGPTSQEVAVPWMRVADAASAQAFADAIRASNRSFRNFASSIASALNFATPLFGTETGAPDNGFTSAVQSITMAMETFQLLTHPPAAAAAARDDALAAGVDVINAITIGTLFSDDANAYYETNVVGGGANGVPGGVANAADYGALPTVAGTALGDQVITLVVPEPSSGLLATLGLGAILLLRRRRGN